MVGFGGLKKTIDLMLSKQYPLLLCEIPVRFPTFVGILSQYMEDEWMEEEKSLGGTYCNTLPEKCYIAAK